MEVFKGTKGDWIMDCRTKACEEYPNYLPIISKDETLIALVNHNSVEINIHEYVANAEIIRAAPRMLEALQNVKEILESPRLIDAGDLRRIVNSAIDKALGL